MAVDQSSWATKDIVYISIVGVVMIAALLEWVLWLTAFLYCLFKVFQKAEDIGTRVLAIVMMIIFSLIRAVFLPVMIVTLPLPSHIMQYFPHGVVSFFQWFAFWAFSSMLIIPWLLCVYQLVTRSLGRAPLIRQILEEFAAPKIVIVVPCFKEVPDILLRTIDSIVDCDYPSACLHVFLSFDGDREDGLYLKTIGKLGVPLVRQSGYPASIDVTYRSTRVTISKFAHGGKRHCQKKTFKLIDRVYNEYLTSNDNLFVLFIDSDCILDKICIQNFMYEMELKPGSKRDMLAMTGIITATTEKNSLITLLQDIELKYIHGQLFERSVESVCGAVTCLPGALTILRFSAFRKLAKYYFADKAEQCDDLFDYGKCHLGEDRWLTHLFLVAARYGQVGMSTGAFCKTEAVQTLESLLKQRRRWFLGFITNEVCMLTDKRVWIRYPLLCLVRLAQNTIRTTALLFFILVIALCTTSQRVEDLPVGFIAVSLGLNWVLMIYFATLLGRYKITLYPLLFIVGPFLNWAYMVYGIFTAGQRTWGGPRADAGQADSVTSPQAVIEHAEETGDDLNVVPETFRPGTEARKTALSPNFFLQPPASVEGRLYIPDRVSSQNTTIASGVSQTIPVLRQLSVRKSTFPHIPLHPRTSLDSTISVASSIGGSSHDSRQAESFVDLEHGRLGTKTRTQTSLTQSTCHEEWQTSYENSTDSGSHRQSLSSTSSDLCTDLADMRHHCISSEEENYNFGVPLLDLNSSTSPGQFPQSSTCHPDKTFQGGSRVRTPILQCTR